MQGKDRPGKKKSKEMKVAVAYKGWEYDGKGNTKLVGKIMIAGMENATEFLAIREAMLSSKHMQRVWKVRNLAIKVVKKQENCWIILKIIKKD